MASKKELRARADAITAAGIEVVGFEPTRGSHYKVRCRLGTYEFFVLVSISKATSTRHAANFTAKLKRIRRAFDDGDEERLMAEINLRS